MGWKLVGGFGDVSVHVEAFFLSGAFAQFEYDVGRPLKCGHETFRHRDWMNGLLSIFPNFE